MVLNGVNSECFRHIAQKRPKIRRLTKTDIAKNFKK